MMVVWKKCATFAPPLEKSPIVAGVEARTQPVVVVVSALDGITDKLIAISQMALKGDKRYREEFDGMMERHHQMIDTIITDPQKRENLFKRVDSLFEQLKSIYYGVYFGEDAGCYRVIR